MMVRVDGKYLMKWGLLMEMDNCTAPSTLLADTANGEMRMPVVEALNSSTKPQAIAHDGAEAAPPSTAYLTEGVGSCPLFLEQPTTDANARHVDEDPAAKATPAAAAGIMRPAGWSITALDKISIVGESFTGGRVLETASVSFLEGSNLLRREQCPYSSSLPCCGRSRIRSSPECVPRYARAAAIGTAVVEAVAAAETAAVAAGEARPAAIALAAAEAAQMAAVVAEVAAAMAAAAMTTSAGSMRRTVGGGYGRLLCTSRTPASEPLPVLLANPLPYHSGASTFSAFAYNHACNLFASAPDNGGDRHHHHHHHH
ncbi:hypothetical protein Vretimale_1857, partial [Volvox reticuliferus]